MLTKVAIARITGVKPHEVNLIEEWTNCIFVKVKGRAKFISKRAIERDFVESRKQRTRVLKVTQVDDGFEVENLEIGSRYKVTQANGFSCTCKDYENYGEGHYCKHIYAVVESFGDCGLNGGN